MRWCFAKESKHHYYVELLNPRCHNGKLMGYQSGRNWVCVLTLPVICMALGKLLGPSEFILRTGLI